MTEKESLIPYERIAGAIYIVRGQKVMLDRDLAALYGVETRVLSQSVKRNRDHFPPDFMFELSRNEIMRISQTVISSAGLKYANRAHVFTEQGVAMLSGILNSKRAIEVNIAIMRTFVRLREFLMSQAKLARRLRALEQEVAAHGKDIGTMFEVLQQLTSERPAAVGFQCIEGGDAADDSTVREHGVRYRTVASRARRSRKARRGGSVG